MSSIQFSDPNISCWGEQPQCCQDQQWSAVAWCATGSQTGGTSGDGETHGERTAHGTEAKETWMGPEVTAGKPPPCIKETHGERQRRGLFGRNKDILISDLWIRISDLAVMGMTYSKGLTSYSSLGISLPDICIFHFMVICKVYHSSLLHTIQPLHYFCYCSVSWCSFLSTVVAQQVDQ